MEPADTASRHWAMQLCRSAGFEPDVRFETADLIAHIRLIESGNAVGILPDLVWAGAPAERAPGRSAGSPGAHGLHLGAAFERRAPRRSRRACGAGGCGGPGGRTGRRRRVGVAARDIGRMPGVSYNEHD